MKVRLIYYRFLYQYLNMLRIGSGCRRHIVRVFFVYDYCDNAQGIFVLFFSCPQQFLVISYLHVYADKHINLGKQYPYNGYERAGNPEHVPDPPTITWKILILNTEPIILFSFTLFNIHT